MTSFTTNNTTPASTTKESNLREPLVATIDSGPVQAYAKLEGDDFCYYIRTLQVSLGRKVNSPENVDIPLGNTKSVSRQHARLFYNFTMQRFELMVFGKNGAFVNEQFIERGVTVPLENKTKIQIGEMAFVFLLPKPDADTVNTNNNASPHNHDNNFGYISTPQQLEKNITKTTTSPPIQPSLLEDDFEMSEEPNPYSNKNTKPPYSYASLIAQAINSCKEGRMTLNGIYNYITTNYPYYQMAQNGWQNSIRHNLSLNKAFIKVPRGETEPPGKGAFWTIDDSAITQFTDGVYKNKRTGSNIPPAEHTKKKIKKDIKANSSDHSEEEEEDELIEEEEPDIKKEEEKEQDINKGKIKQDITLNVNKEITVIEKKTVANIPKVKEEVITSSETTTNSNNNTQEAQAQLQAQLQNTIRQHLLDPVRYPLPPSIAQLLPHAIAQLPPQLATQLSSTLQTNINVVGNEFSNNNHLPETTTVNDDKIIKADDPPIK